MRASSVSGTIHRGRTQEDVFGVDASLFDMLHHAPIDHVLTVRRRLRPLRSRLPGSGGCRTRTIVRYWTASSYSGSIHLIVIGDHHGPPAQHVEKDAPAPDNLSRWLLRCASSTKPPSRPALRDLSSSSSFPNVPVFRQVDQFGEVPMMLTPATFKGSARFRGVCPPNCTITPTTPKKLVLAVGNTSSSVSGSKYSGRWCRNRSKPSPDCS